MKSPNLRVALIAIVIVMGLSACSKANSVEKAAEKAKAEKEAKDRQALESAYKAYDTALRANDTDGLRASFTPENAAEMDKPEAVLGVRMASKLRESDLKVLSYTVVGDIGTVQMKGTLEGALMTGNVSFSRVGDAWRVTGEHWSISFDDPSFAPPVSSMPEPVRRLVDRVAADDAIDSGKAWLEIGARYQNAPAFLADIKPALWDTRPIHFEMVEETFAGGTGGRSFRYFTVKGSPSQTKTVPARTVGEALRYHLWQYEDVSNSGFTGSFHEWWSGYAAKNKLPNGE